MALPTKLTRICRSRPGSPRSRVGTSEATVPANSSPLSWARWASISSVSSTVLTRSKSRTSKLSLPASILDKSRISLMIARSVSALVRIVSANSRCCGFSSPSSSRPAIPITPFIGVRISWLMLAKNSLLVRAAASAASLARVRFSSTCLFAVTSQNMPCAPMTVPASSSTGILMMCTHLL